LFAMQRSDAFYKFTQAEPQWNCNSYTEDPVSSYRYHIAKATNTFTAVPWFLVVRNFAV
jgi:hypothetical protein